MVHDAADVPAGPGNLDSVGVAFDEQRLISDAGLLVTATLAQRLGIEELVSAATALGIMIAVPVAAPAQGARPARTGERRAIGKLLLPRGNCVLPRRAARLGRGLHRGALRAAWVAARHGYLLRFQDALILVRRRHNRWRLRGRCGARGLPRRAGAVLGGLT